MKKILSNIALLQQFFFLHVAYGVGIGIPAIVAKITGKHFLQISPPDTTWVKHKPSHSHKTMY